FLTQSRCHPPDRLRSPIERQLWVHISTTSRGIIRGVGRAFRYTWRRLALRVRSRPVLFPHRLPFPLFADRHTPVRALVHPAWLTEPVPRFRDVRLLLPLLPALLLPECGEHRSLQLGGRLQLLPLKSGLCFPDTLRIRLKESVETLRILVG